MSIDPENVLIRCPNGHELQARKADLDVSLACPVCNVVFRPGGPAVTTTPSTSYAANYASPVEPPSFTMWLLGAWGLFAVLSAIVTIGQLAIDRPVSADGPPAMSSLIIVSCVQTLMMIAAIIMQLVWIYRVHADAHRVGSYDGPGAGTALIGSLIPPINVAWTGWLLHRLAGFAADAPEMGAAQRAQSMTTRKAGLTVLVVGIILGVSCLGMTIYNLPETAASVRQAYEQQQREAGQAAEEATGDETAITPEPNVPLSIFAIVLQVGAIGIYLWAVRLIEPALYQRLRMEQTRVSDRIDAPG